MHNGFDGLLQGQLEELAWMSVDEWAAKGGSKLGTVSHHQRSVAFAEWAHTRPRALRARTAAAAGTARTLPSQDYGMVAFFLQKFRVEALLVIGGFEGFEALSELLAQRPHFPQFCIPMVLLPASISNNIPGTDISLGSDTALNIITQSCDQVRCCALCETGSCVHAYDRAASHGITQIKESASSIHGRVYVVEVMGGQCGYLATAASLAGAGMRAYIPENGISFETLAEDIVVSTAEGGARRGNMGGRWG